MIEICSFNAKTLTKTTFAPFAWFSWPMEIIRMTIATVRNTVELASTGKTIQIDGGPVKELYVRAGGLRDIKRQEVVKTGSLTPIRRVVRYEDAEDFKKVSSV